MPSIRLGSLSLELVTAVPKVASVPMNGNNSWTQASPKASSAVPWPKADEISGSSLLTFRSAVMTCAGWRIEEHTRKAKMALCKRLMSSRRAKKQGGAPNVSGLDTTDGNRQDHLATVQFHHEEAQASKHARTHARRHQPRH